VPNTNFNLVNFLQLPAGSGEEVYFDFDISTFTKQFRLGLLTTTYSIKALEQEGVITYNEQIFLPPTIVFCCSKQTLEELEKSYPNVEPYIKFLLRSYGGIFDVPTAISEKLMAQKLKKDVAGIKKVLQWLAAKNIIIYTPQKETPQIQFLYNRVTTENLSINAADYNSRKKNLVEQVQSMEAYVNNRKQCRAQIIAQYFDDFAAQPCGICDNCLELKKSKAFTKEDFSMLYNKIIHTLNNTPLTIKELMHRVYVADETKMWKLIDHLMAEQKIEMDEKSSRGKVRAKKKGQDKNPARF